LVLPAARSGAALGTPLAKFWRVADYAFTVRPTPISRTMDPSVKCNLCSKPATVHLTQIVNNQIHKLDLCEECAAAKGVTDPSGFSLADLLIKSSGIPGEGTSTGTQLVCEHCGFTQADFKKHGRFGCPACYERFRPILEPVLANMHKGMTHLGKVPARSLERKSLLERVALLEKQLHDAIKAERYEDAARLRDEISHVKAAPAAKPETLSS
jgi:protein arginine kinase activator